MSTVLFEKEGFVGTVTLNRPDKLNALNAELVGELHRVLAEVRRDKDLRALIVTGAGDKAFAAGADIAAMSTMTGPEAKAFGELGHAVGAQMETLAIPVIAAVNGFALGGGCEMALACDFIHASTKAKFGQPEVNLGVIPGFGGTNRLARRVGIGRARELCFTGDVIGAEEALRIGLINGIHAPEDLLGKVKEIAAKIATKGPLAVAQAKRVLLRGLDVPLPTANELEVQAFAALFGSEDQREGMAAFLGKRPANFVGR